jgi:nucleotide-binding universal stress UspA family protein
MFSIKKIIVVDSGFTKEKKLADYLDFLATKIIIKKIFYLHILKSTTYNLSEKILNILKETIESERITPFLKTYKNVDNIEGEVVSGKAISELKHCFDKEKANLIVIQNIKNSHHLIKNVVRHIDCNMLFVPKNARQELKTILIPVDLSEHSNKLLDTAIDMQKQSKDKYKIICYHAYEIPDVPYYNILRTEKQMQLETREIVNETFNKFISKYRQKGLDIVPVLYQEANSWPSYYILKYIKDHSVDLVIMGAHNHSKFDTWLGSTVEKVITKNNKCPMLIVKS